MIEITRKSEEEEMVKKNVNKDEIKSRDDVKTIFFPQKGLWSSIHWEREIVREKERDSERGWEEER
jgi:hypothetical protein